MRNALAAFLLMAASACGLPPPVITVASPDPVTLPFRVAAGGLVLLTGRVNDAHDVDFILDTGAPVTVLVDNARTRALRLDTTGARRLGPEGDPASPVGVIRSGFSVAFGPVAMTELTAVVLPGSSLPCPERFDSVGFGGVVGADLFRRFVVEVDWDDRVVRLHEPGAWRPPAGARAVALDFEANQPYVQATVRLAGGREAPVRLHLDTGMSNGLALATGPGSAFTAPADGKESTSCFVNGRAHAREGAPVAITLGDATLEGVTPVYAPAQGASATRKTGALGAGALRRQPLYVDYPRSRILIGRPSPQ